MRIVWNGNGTGMRIVWNGNEDLNEDNMLFYFYRRRKSYKRINS